MVSPDCNSAAEGRCSSEKLPPLSVIFPWKALTANPPVRPAPRDGAQKAQIEIDGADRIAPPILPDEGKAKLIDKIKLEIHTSQSIQTVEPKTLSAAELHRLYTDTLIPQHRYLAPSLSEAVNSPEIGPHPAKWLAGISEINLSRVVNAWLNTNRSTEYEELYCIGLDQESGRLTGVLTVKQGGGYSGGPGTAGSREHIAFWVDWGWGFQYEGTASVAVHDFGCLPPAGLEYNVALPVDLLSRMPLGGEGAKTVKVRAVLSWSTPPSTTDPNAPIVWGNRVESRIPIPHTRQARGGNPVPCLAASATETDQTSSDGRIVDAAIKALTGMDLGLCAGLTVAPESAIASTSVTERSFTINSEEIEDGSNPFTLVVTNCSNINRGAKSDLNHAPDQRMHARDEAAGSTGLPQTQTGATYQSGFRLQPLRKEQDLDD